MPEEMIAMSALGELIREVREQRGMSQRDLANKAEISSSTVSFIERGLTEKPDPDTLISVANALGVDQHALFERAGILPSREQIEIPPEISDLMEDLLALRGTALYNQAMKSIREIITLTILKLDPPPDK